RDTHPLTEEVQKRLCLQKDGEWRFYSNVILSQADIQAAIGADLKDYLTQLTNDCLLDLFTRLDHSDLDEVAVLSARLSRLSVTSRPKARPNIATKLRIFSQARIASNCIELRREIIDNLPGTEDSEKYKFQIEYNGRQIPLIMHSYNLANLSTSTNVLPPLDPGSPHGSANRTVMILGRFTFESCKFVGNTIDENVIAYFELQVPTCLFSSLRLHSGRTNWETALSERFVSLIHSKLPLTLSLGYILMGSSVDTIEGIINLLLKRLHVQKDGEWRFYSNVILSSADIQSAIGADLKYSEQLGSHFISTANAKHEVEVETTGTVCIATYRTAPHDTRMTRDMNDDDDDDDDDDEL
ncbi:hypothetical protein PRIPAC_93168, partial [Pristionchus pacificus]|uniref:Uncharacterized protein n=1 Tax=Pristionchus pacificus TaxID=54126 RepID=A0A2A6CD54_PRIPA